MKRKIQILAVALFVMLSFNAFSQNVGINSDGSNPDNSAMLDVKSTSKGFLPPRMTQSQRDAITPVAGLMVYNTTTNQPNYYNGTEWMNYDGTSAKTLAIGDSYQGGIIAYILQPGDPGYDANVQHGLIAAPSDQSASAEWGCNGTPISGADGTAIGTGAQNTIDIVTGCVTAGIAAHICNDLELDGYSDWYLPSIDELAKLYENRVAIGGFNESEFYWSSLENDDSNANIYYFGDGTSYTDGKNYTYPVRAVRDF